MNYKFYFIFVLILSGYLPLSAQYIIHIAGNNTIGFSGDGGLAVKAALIDPAGICRDNEGNLYIADFGNNRIRKITAATGIINTIAGGGVGSATGDNIPATSASISGPYGLCIDNANNLYFANGMGRIRKINLSTGIITTFAGVLTGGYTGDGGPATSAELGTSTDVALDLANNIYIADYGNNVIRKVTASTGIITTVAGTGVAGYNGDNIMATAAALHGPTGVYIDNASNLYIAEQANNRVRRVDAITGIITTVAGIGPSGGIGSLSGDGGPATAAGLNYPSRVTMDNLGNLYISDLGNVRIRKVSVSTGIITTYAGSIIPSGGIDSTGDGGPATGAAIQPFGMCFDSCGNLFFADQGNRVRAITPTLPVKGRLCGYDIDESVPGLAGIIEGLSIVPNPNAGSFTLNISSGLDEAALITITNMVGQVVRQFTALTNKEQELHLSGPPGVYFITASTTQGRWSGKVVVE